MNKENYFKRIEYCRSNGLALLSASVVMAVCHDSRVFRVMHIRNSLRQNSGHSATFKQIWSTRFALMTAVGATLEKAADVYRREEKNASETLNIVTKDRTSQTMYG